MLTVISVLNVLLAERLARGEAIEEPVAVVVAHPDDEVLWLGSRLPLLRTWRLIHLTDGAPRDLQDARRAGFQTWREYALARRVELQRALQALHARPAGWTSFGIADQESVHHLVSIAERLTTELAGMQAVLTHAYEHGHPDHDSTACAVHAACALLERRGGQAPQMVEFASYHALDGQLVRGRFWPEPNLTESVVSISAQSRADKARALECFVSQLAFLQQFATLEERLRAAPVYDFTEPAPPGEALYDAFEWRITGALWREAARRSLQQLDLHDAI
jgi:LmbE family N-acetylglucosaminyl deacetylase